jgi:hypothetical protein
MAPYTAYKYRHQKAKLWRNLEKKYGHPVLSVEEFAKMDKVESGGSSEHSAGETDEEVTKETEQETPDL